MKQMKAITFDFGGTLAHGDLDKNNYRRALIDYILRLGFSGGKAKLNKARKAMLERLSTAQKRNKELRFENLYQDLLFQLGIHPTKENLDYIQQLYYRYFKIELLPGVPEMLLELSEKYKLAIVSNTISNASRLVLDKHDLEKYFDCIVLSRDLGIRKPDLEIFNFTLENLGLKAIEAIHVGDSLEQDVQGAKNVGMKTVWIKGDNETQNIQPDFIISKVTDLPSLL